MNDTTFRRSRGFRATALALAATAAFACVPRTAHAEDVSPTGKGIVGGALLGGEAVVFVEALIGIRSTPAYLIGAGAGAVAGGVGGAFLENSVTDGRVPAYLLAGGLALVIPALVIALNQTRYIPPEGAREDKPANLPPSDPGKPGGTSVIGAEPAATTPNTTTTPAGTTPPATTVPAGGTTGGTPGPQSLFDVHQGDFRVGLPIPSVRPVFSVSERKSFGVVNPGNEVRFPVVHVAF